MSRIYVGTSSWSDHENFYPAGLPSTQQISYYAQHFPLVEINSTYYRMMPARNYQLWADRTPPGFVFDVKPYKQLTFHDRDNPPSDEAHDAFSASVQPLRDAGKLGALHFQFAPWFMQNKENLQYMLSLRERYPDDRIAVEFRQRSWYEEEPFSDLVDAFRQASLALTVVDEPQIGSGTVPTLLEVTNPELVIVRFHGRNASTWYKRTQTTGERFNYLYSEEELREWVPRVAELAELAVNVHVLFNNNAQDYAIQNARQLRMLLRDNLSTAEVVTAPEE